MQKIQPSDASSTLLQSLSLDELLTIITKQRGKLEAVNQEQLTERTTAAIRKGLDKDTALLLAEIESRMSNYGAKIVFNEEAGNVEMFVLSKINPLDNMPVREIIGCEIVGEWIHLQCVNKHGVKYLKKVMNTRFIREQIEQHHISIEANV